MRRIKCELDNELLKIKDLKRQKLLDDELQNNAHWSIFVILVFIVLLFIFAFLR